MKKAIGQFCKYGLVFAAGIGFSQIYGWKQINLKEQFDAKSELLRDYLKEHNYSYPKFYDNYLTLVNKDHFLEKLILKESGGLEHYKIFLPQPFIDRIFEDNSQVPIEDKLKLSKMSCIFTAGTSVQSHKGVVHGGFQATMIDNMFGYLGTLANDLKPCATATLSINYKKPVMCGQEYIIKVEVTKIEGRKVYLSARVEDQNGNVHTESTALMISVNWGTSSWKKMFNTLHSVTKLNQAPQLNILQLTQKDEDYFHPEIIFQKQHLKLRRPVSSLFDELNS